MYDTRNRIIATFVIVMIDLIGANNCVTDCTEGEFEPLIYARMIIIALSKRCKWIDELKYAITVNSCYNPVGYNELSSYNEMVFGRLVALVMQITTVITKSNRGHEGFVLTRVHCSKSRKKVNSAPRGISLREGGQREYLSNATD